MSFDRAIRHVAPPRAAAAGADVPPEPRRFRPAFLIVGASWAFGHLLMNPTKPSAGEVLAPLAGGALLDYAVSRT